MYAFTYRRAYAPTPVRKSGERFQYSARQSAEVKNILGRRHVQARLTIGSANDRFEQEAGRVADQVMQSSTPGSAELLETGGARGAVGVQRLCSECEEAPRSKLANSGAHNSSLYAPSIVREVLRAPGVALDEGARGFFEPRFGVDFGHVRVHTDRRAQQSAQALNAQAYTVGPNVVFGAGGYSPDSVKGRRLLAHELTHVVQQGGISSNEGAIQRKCESEFPCLRTPIPPGQVRFNGCGSEQLSDYAVIPESGTTLVTPVNDVWYDTDGLWFRHHASGNEWFKIPGHCDVEIHCDDRDFSCSKCCNIAATAVFGNPRWTADPHGTTNPFA